MKKIVCVIVLIIISFSLTNSYASGIFDWLTNFRTDKSEFEFEINSDNTTYSLINYTPSRKSSPDLIIPAKYNNLSVTKIRSQAFYACEKLESLVIPEGITSIGSYAFYQCENLKSIQLPQSLSYIGEYAFESCDSLETLYIPQATEIGFSAFSTCTNLKNVSIGIESENITIGASSVGDYAFYDCSNLKTVTLGKSVTYVGDSTFKSCENLTTVNLTNNVWKIDSSAFEYCTNLERINFNGTVSEWEAIKKGAWWDKSTGLFEVICSR